MGTNQLAFRHELTRAYQSNETNHQIKLAVEVLEQVTVVRGHTLSEADVDLLASIHRLAFAYETDGQTELAMEVMEHMARVLTISRQRTPRPSVPSTSARGSISSRRSNQACREAARTHRQGWKKHP